MEIANLTRLVEQGSGLALGEESTLNDLIKQKEELIRERDQQVRSPAANHQLDKWELGCQQQCLVPGMHTPMQRRPARWRGCAVSQLHVSDTSPVPQSRPFRRMRTHLHVHTRMPCARMSRWTRSWPCGRS